MKSHIIVVGAAIVKDGKILACKRSDGDDEVIHKFEFVGGKVEEGETPEEALIRECREELSLEIEVGDLLNTIVYEYPNTTVTLSVYFAKPLSDYKLTVHEVDKWFNISELDAEEWAPADRTFLNTIKKGVTKINLVESDGEIQMLSDIACEVVGECLAQSLEKDQLDYMLNLFLSPQSIKSNIEERGYTYKLIYFNGEAAGFCGYCPANVYDSSLNEGVFLSYLYIKSFAQGKRIAEKIVSSLSRPVYLTVKRDSEKSVNIFKHFGFKIMRSVKTEIGNGYFMDDFLMVLGK